MVATTVAAALTPGPVLVEATHSSCSQPPASQRGYDTINRGETIHTDLCGEHPVVRRKVVSGQISGETLRAVRARVSMDLSIG